MSPRRVALVGLGAISRYYLAAIDDSPRWELVALCDVRAEALAPYRDDVRCFSDHRELLEHAEADAMIVTVPNDVHAAVCRDALRAGIPVCVEKPLAVSLDEGRDLLALAERQTVPLFTALHRRYNDSMLALRDRIAAGGGLTELTVRYLERIEEHIDGDTWYLDPARCGGGCVADNGPNAFDLVRFFLGKVVVVASSITRDERGVDRRAVVELRSPDGVPATVELDWSYPGERKDAEAVLRDGTTHRANMLAGHVGFKSSLWHEYAGILADFDAVLSARLPGVGRFLVDDGLAALDLVAQSYQREPEGAR